MFQFFPSTYGCGYVCYLDVILHLTIHQFPAKRLGAKNFAKSTPPERNMALFPTNVGCSLS